MTRKVNAVVLVCTEESTELHTLSIEIKLTLSIAFPTLDTVLCRSLCSDAILCTVSRILFIVCRSITIWAAVN
jgi:hypothetical protein